MISSTTCDSCRFGFGNLSFLAAAGPSGDACRSARQRDFFVAFRFAPRWPIRCAQGRADSGLPRNEKAASPTPSHSAGTSHACKYVTCTMKRTPLASISFSLFLFFALLSQIQAQSAPAPDLFKTIQALDTKLFDAYNSCDLATLASLVADDLEFYHDVTGFSAGR